ncbi:MAG: hypothetical protein IKJ37_14710 [Kiritimatiellae bacterium]|nr:hypothetical protein [Kiritimatiellia bacterium]
MRTILSVMLVLAPFVSLFSNTVNTNEVSKVYVAPFKTAVTLGAGKVAAQDANWESVALGKPLLTSRLAGAVSKFSCVSDAKTATYELSSVLTTLRSKENVYRSSSYGVETKTTNWQLDLIVALKRLSDGVIVFSKTVTGFCNEQRPISEAKFDNDLFHSLMVAAIEEAAEDIIEYFAPAPAPVSSFSSGTVTGAASGSKSSLAQNATVGSVKERESLAVLKPRAGEGVTEAEAVMLWDYLESKLGGGRYAVVSRADVSRMMDEVGLTTSSYLTDPMMRKRAKIGKLATVSKLLASSVGRFGKRYLLTLKVFDSSTAEIDGERAESVSAEEMDGLLPLAADAMRRLLAPPPEGFALAPVEVRLAGAPSWLASAAFEGVRSALAEAGIGVKTDSDANAAVKLVPSVTMYSLRLVDEGGASRHRGSISIQLSANGASPITVKLTDVDLGKVEGAAPSWLAKERGEKLLALAIEQMQQKLSALKAK